MTLVARRSFLLLGLALALLLVAVFLPGGWYDRLPQKGEAYPASPVGGLSLLRLAFGVEGLLLLFLGLGGRLWHPVARRDLLRLPDPATPPRGDLSRPAAWLAAATLLGAGLRLADLGSDLWLDEIATVLGHRDLSLIQILTAYTSANNHLLNTLLVRAMVSVFGAAEWAIRLPAVLLGIACIPAQYALARLALGRRDAFLAAALLALSYHHVFFSQNARGYTGLLLGSLLGSAFFLRALSRDRTRDWVLYVLSMLLAVAAVPIGLFVVAGHVLALPAVGWVVARQGGSWRPLAKKALTVWLVLGLLCFHLYATVLPRAYAFVTATYTSAATGYAPFSLAHLEELWRGVLAGFGGGGVAGVVAVLAVVGMGWVLFARRHALFTLILASPLVVTALTLLAWDVRFTPRVFLWALPVAFIFTVGALSALAARFRGYARVRARGSRPVETTVLSRLADVAPGAAVGVLLLLSLASLRDYYRIPKQPTRTSLEWVLARKAPDDPLVTVYLAKWGTRFYGPSLGLEEGSSYFVAHSRQEIEGVERENRGRTVWLLTTFPRTLRVEYSALDRYIRDRYGVERVFPATIAGGEVTVWKRET